MIHNMSNCTTKETWKLAKIKSLEVAKQKKLERIRKYLENPTKCLHCGSIFKYEDRNKKFCNQSCSASFNNTGRIKNTNGINKHKKTKEPKIRISKQCANCGVDLGIVDDSRRYCSEECAHSHRHLLNVLDWKSNPDGMKVLTQSIRKYILNEANNKCCQCGWGEVNQYSGNYALIVDHIDGNSENNTPENLRVLCPNCDSLLPTYKALNKGKGRAYRRARYADGKSY